MGQLGDFTSASRERPVPVVGYETGGVTFVSSTSDHTCAVLADTSLKCWGGNAYGQVGNGTSGNAWLGAVPVCETGSGFFCTGGNELIGIASVATGDRHTCALMLSGGVKCWGDSFFGQIGDGISGTAAGSTLPVDVPGLSSGVTHISAGGFNTCAILTGGALKCWGNNYNGQLGIGTFPNAPLAAGETCPSAPEPGAKCLSRPADVTGLSSGAAEVAVFDTTCARTTGGAAKCWGYNGNGEVGSGAVTPANPGVPIGVPPNHPVAMPTDVVGLTSGVDAIAQSCALLATGAAQCWGDNFLGQLGDGSFTNSATPVDVTGLPGPAATAPSGGAHRCIVLSDGLEMCWGSNSSGQLGAPSDICYPGFLNIACSASPLEVLFGFVVNTTSDASDAGVNDRICDTLPATPGRQCSLRAAIEQGNAIAGTDYILFDIGSGVRTISPASLLPELVSTTLIDGRTQGGYAGKPLIEIDGTIAGPAANGLVLMARGSTVRGLAINRFQLNGLWLLGEGEHLVEANYIGLDPTGELDQGNAQSGIRIDSPDNVVGLSAAAFAAEARNVISGNGMDGIAIFGAFAKNNLVRGNFIGTDDDAETAIANAGDGVAISGASENEIGHHDGGIATRSVIAGNTRNGISIVGASAVLNRIRGNHIGITDVGNTALGNGDNGIDVQSPFNVIGGTAADHRNVIGGNGEDGLLLHNAADQNQILGNRIGVGVSSELPPLPNGSGILISDAEQNIIGGAQDGAGNLLAGNTNFGLAIIGTDAIRNQVSGNDIGWAAGDTVGNGLGGVLIHDGSANIIGGLQGVEPGGTCQGDCNSISDNGGAGVIVTGDAATNRIRGNSIFRNAGLGIDLGRDGITWGDPGDLDVGPNALFNAPEIVSVTFSASTVTFTGTLDTQNPAAAFVDVYASSFLGAGGLTEGTRYVGSTSPDANGNWTLTTSVTLSDSDYYTATASGQFGPTSEFSHCVDPDGDGSPDSDGDGLCDTWETLGIDFDGDEVIDLQLYDLDQDGTVQAGERADPMHKDLFVEADWMAQHQPNSQALAAAVASFAAAPVANPDGTTGIRLHVQRDELAAAHASLLAFTPCTSAAAAGSADFDSIKSASFGTAAERGNPKVLGAKRLVTRYALFAHSLQGRGSTSGCAELPGNDFVVTLGGWSTVGGHAVGSPDQQAGTFMHEMGHTLDLRHGGATSVNCKPNYISVMSYSRQFSSPTGRTLDYSRLALPALNENSLDESAGISGLPGEITVYGPIDPIGPPGVPAPSLGIMTGGAWVVVVPTDDPIDWNFDGDTSDTGVASDINRIRLGGGGCGFELDSDADGTNDAEVLSTLGGHDDWSNIRYNFRHSPDFADGVHQTHDEDVEEITFEEAASLSPDTDGDALVDLLDNCPNIANPGQEDADDDFEGDACEAVTPTPTDTPTDTPTLTPTPTAVPTDTSTPTNTPTASNTPTPTSTPSNGVFVVNSTVDAVDAAPGNGVCASAAGECTLRAAVMEANRGAGATRVITVPAGTYRLTLGPNDPEGDFAEDRGDLDLGGSKQFTIIGAGIDQTIVDATGFSRVFDVRGGAELRGMTLQNSGAQGIIHRQSDHGLPMTLDRVRVTGITGGGSAAVLSLGLVIVKDSRVENNAGGGFGLFFTNAQARLELYDSTVSGHGDTGIRLDQNKSALIVRSTISDNESSGDGGGIYNIGSTVTIIDSTISGNRASGRGGGLANLGTSTITNSTFSGNSAGMDGGAIFNDYSAVMTLSDSTVVANLADADGNGTGDGGGLTSPAAGSVTRTIIDANGDAAGETPDCAGVFTSGGNNLIGDSAGCVLVGDAGSSVLGTPAGLFALADNGGPTHTHALAPASAALDAAGDGCPPADQRGATRPQGAACDIGAYERDAGAPDVADPPALPAPASPGVIAVNDFADSPDAALNGVCADATGVCTLRAAIMEANFQAGPQVIDLRAGTFLLSRPTTENFTVNASVGDLDVVDDLLVRGAGSGQTIIDGGALDHIFGVAGPNAVPSIPQAVMFELQGVSVVNGAPHNRAPNCPCPGLLEHVGPANGGGGIQAELTSVVSLVDVIVSDNVGWGISGGTIIVRNSEVSNNTHQGIIGTYSTLGVSFSIVDSTVSNNGLAGIAFSSFGSNSAFVRSRIEGNGASGISLTGSGTAYVVDSTIANNSGQSGGGINSNVNLVISGSTISGNTAPTPFSGFGGGIASAGSLTILNSTISGNSTSGDGGGLSVSTTAPATAELINVTITGNSADSDADGQGNGGGIRHGGNRTTMRNVLIGGNRDLSAPASDPDDDLNAPDCAASFQSITSAGHNLIADPKECFRLGDADSDITGVDAQLGPLADNGGRTETHSLLAESPAVDAGANVGCPAIDQRGVSRPQGSSCDIGAFEADGVFAPTATATPPATATSTASPTATETAVPTATETPEPTNTATPTPTNTGVPTATDTATPTATNTVIATATNTSTPAATDTAIATATNTPTPTATNTASATPSGTLTPTSTATFTWTPSPTASPTEIPSVTPMPTVAAASATPTRMTTMAPGRTATPRGTQTATRTRTAVPTATNTPKPKATKTTTRTKTAVPTATNTPKPKATKTISGTSTPRPNDQKCADVTGDGRVTLKDVLRIVERLGSGEDEKRYARKYDINDDRKITGLDVALAVKQLGERCRQ